MRAGKRGLTVLTLLATGMVMLAGAPIADASRGGDPVVNSKVSVSLDLPKVFTSKNFYLDTAGHAEEVIIYRDLIKKRQRWDIKVLAPEVRNYRLIADYNLQRGYEIDLDANTCTVVPFGRSLVLKPIRLLRGAKFQGKERVAGSQTWLYKKFASIPLSNAGWEERYLVGPDYSPRRRVTTYNVARTGNNLNLVAIRERQILHGNQQVQSFTLVTDMVAHQTSLPDSVFTPPQNGAAASAFNAAAPPVAPRVAGDLEARSASEASSRLLPPVFVAKNFVLDFSSDFTSEATVYFDSIKDRHRQDIRILPPFEKRVRLLYRYDLQRVYEIDLDTRRCNSFPLTGELLPPRLSDRAVFMGTEQIGNSQVEVYRDPDIRGFDTTLRLFRNGDHLEYVSATSEANGSYSFSFFSDFVGSDAPLPDPVFAIPPGCADDTVSTKQGSKILRLPGFNHLF